MGGSRAPPRPPPPGYATEHVVYIQYTTGAGLQSFMKSYRFLPPFLFQLLL